MDGLPGTMIGSAMLIALAFIGARLYYIQKALEEVILR